MFYPANYLADLVWVGLAGSIIYFNKISQGSVFQANDLMIK
jgi:hypothetical protein